MAKGIWDTSGGNHRRRKRRQGGFYLDIPGWAGYIVVVCALILCGELFWQGVQYFRRPGSPEISENEIATSGERGPAANAARAIPPINSGAMREISGSSAPDAPWQNDALQSFAAGLHDATAGNIIAAEMDLDRGTERITEAHARSEAAAPEFFTASVDSLNRVMRGREGNARLEEHATLARIELAQLRSAQNEMRDAGAQSGEASDASNGSGTMEPKDASSVAIYAPRSIAANETLNPASLGAGILDARMMPDASEILLPPSTRAFEDNVHVDHLRLEGAAQTLDGIHWSNVVFADTRVRYEGHGLDLEKVKFVRCTFGFPVDARGAQLANAIALGQTSISMEPSPPEQTVPSDVDPNDVNP